MDAGHTTLEEFLGSILRGAAKLLGCSSTNLILINERSQEIRVFIGAMAVSYPLMEQVEQFFGGSFNRFTVPLSMARDSLILAAWRHRDIRETASLQEIIGGALVHDAVDRMTQIIGEYRFICVPALSRSRNYGVLLFTKQGKHPFSRQQREVLIRYARRIGEIIERQGQNLVAHAPPSGPDYLLFDAEGELVGSTGDSAQSVASSAYPGSLSRVVLDFIEQSKEPTQRQQLEPGLSAELSRFRLGQQPSVICALHRGEDSAGSSLENQLLQLTLGDTAPALFIDPEFNITSCNPATEQVLGYDANELLQRPIATLFCQPRDILDILGQQILYPDSPHCTESAIAVCRDGTLVASRVEALLLADELQQVVGFLVLIRCAPEVEGQDTSDRLVVQERLATMGEMATQLAHEIRNPLVAIGATLESLGQEENLIPDQRAILETLSQEITRLDMILRDYLTVRHDVAISSVNITEVVQQTRHVLEGARKATGKKIAITMDPSLNVMANYDAIKQVLFNLLLNALEATPHGGTVTCRASEFQHEVSIIIEDQGPGLTADPVECFRPFFTTKKNGTGLGLAVCQKIAKAHGGLVELRNQSSGGCRALLVLPRRRPAVSSSVVEV